MFEEEKQKPSNTDVHKKKQLHKLNPLPTNNIIHYEEMPSVLDSPSTLRNSESN